MGSSGIFNVTGTQGLVRISANGWSDPGATGSTIATDNTTYKAMMLVGNNVAGNSGRGREVKVWDFLNVQGPVQSASGGFIFPDGTVQTTAGGGVSGYEIKTTQLFVVSHGNVDVSCSVGKKVFGGGCNQQSGPDRAIVDSNPIGTSGWHCNVRDVTVNESVTVTAYAICGN
jgi:hypothetical protein